MAESEQWRPVVGYEGLYEVSSTGRLMSLSREVMAHHGPRQTGTRPMNPRVGKNGYYKVALCRAGVYSHRMVHRLVAEAFGLLSEERPVVDHINGNKLDNRVENLRGVNRSENTQNQRRASSRNTTGFLGVGFEKQTNKFRAVIGVNGKYTTLGRFETAEAAHAAYVDAKRRLHPACSI